MATIDHPSLTVSCNLNDFTPEDESVYIYGDSAEERNNYANELRSRAGTVHFIPLGSSPSSFSYYDAGGLVIEVWLRSTVRLEAFLDPYTNRICYLDITGIPHHVWAPLLKIALQKKMNITAVYVEPDEYRANPRPTEGEIFDLSVRINGISPIPGFASLREANDENVCFVPLLGFEGTRFSYLLEQIQPPGGKTVPIVGVPGFRLEYPFHTYQGNRAPLSESRSWRNIRFAKANCPFTLFFMLQDIATQYASDHLKVAPIGTKPHALGAVLFALSTSSAVELVYDHPIRNPSRTIGTGRVLRYPLAGFPVIGATA